MWQNVRFATPRYFPSHPPSIASCYLGRDDHMHAFHGAESPWQWPQRCSYTSNAIAKTLTKKTRQIDRKQTLSTASAVTFLPGALSSASTLILTEVAPAPSLRLLLSTKLDASVRANICCIKYTCSVSNGVSHLTCSLILLFRFKVIHEWPIAHTSNCDPLWRLSTH